MGIAAPGVANMAIQPMIAQKRASNFGEAESLAVTFAASNEGQREVAEEVPEDCDLVSPSSRAYTITCEIGEGQFLQTASRSFRLEVESTYSNPTELLPGQHHQSTLTSSVYHLIHGV